ncbi:MAG: hypothetical protein A2557_01255 [Candidatus Lambdaproteobacteria bacterium RIFOXYD2_FULL_56_26]|uniref:Uncharacterized protein n=1 Tax=Candidatus Lambdaproteobacteria bacterium RIFOXYD2_FULL_56_26 TaxID=1817773 RepID=A0A1F6GLN5_9PROT|nr:MAG: hypothetical protein A2557_01255 [Candidatus Lambdaproteobacteria bacterium RIFOXYD2_FULL_56_26]
MVDSEPLESGQAGGLWLYDLYLWASSRLVALLRGDFDSRFDADPWGAFPLIPAAFFDPYFL